MLAKKIFIAAGLLTISWLFYNGITAFFFQNPAENQLMILNNKNSVSKNSANSLKPIIVEKNKAGILQNISDVIKKPFIKFNTASIEINAGNSIKNSLEDYFIASSKIDFPDSQLVSDAIVLHEKDEDEAIKLLIEVLKEKNKELYAIIPPPEAETIHNNSLWISGKFIEILEKVLNTENEQEITKILDSPETREIQQMTENTKNEINNLIEKYGLETKI